MDLEKTLIKYGVRRMEQTFPEMGAVLIISLLASALGSMILLAPSGSAASPVKIQLCMVIDGSGTINSNEWSIIVNAVSKGVNETVPHDGSVELTIVQFGYTGNTRARTELSPTIIDSATYSIVASHVLEIPKMGGSTSMADGLYLSWMDLKNSPNYQDTARQVINLATDGIPNTRNNNATSDLDGNGIVDAHDDVIQVVNDAANQGLDELDMEGIGISSADITWFKNNVVRPKPGITAPPFSKPGWVRAVANVDEFASTMSEKFQTIIGGNQEVWAPSPLGAFLAGIITVGVTSAVSAFSSAVTNPETFPTQAAAQKLSQQLPDTLKKWLHEFIGSKRKLVIGPRARPPYTVTKFEVVSYGVSLLVLTLAFAYVKAATVDQILVILPTILATSILVEFTKNYVIAVVARVEGVWTEHRLWYFGMTLFMFSSFIFRVPFSSPSRLTHNAPEFTRKSLGLVATAQVLIAIAFAAIFYEFFASGYTLIGNVGIVMCLTMSFFDSIPIPPMNGKEIYDWSKFLWAGLFVTTFTLYMLVLFIL